MRWSIDRRWALKGRRHSRVVVVMLLGMREALAIVGLLLLGMGWKQAGMVRRLLVALVNIVMGRVTRV